MPIKIVKKVTKAIRTIDNDKANPKPAIKQGVFIDDSGQEWTAELLQELIDGYKGHKKFIQIFNHYFGSDDCD